MVEEVPIAPKNAEEYLAYVTPLIAAKKKELEQHEYQQYMKNLEVNAEKLVSGEEGNEEVSKEDGQEEEKKEAPRKKKKKKKSKKEPTEEA